jgi:phosphatidylserine/phosphatidylglycerophosphate/cardiolipin synthase-like enzyme
VSQIIPNNQITLLQNGEAYFPAIEVALDRAVHEIYLDSYIFKNDNTGQRIGEALRRAALRGVIPDMAVFSKQGWRSTNTTGALCTPKLL